MTDISLEKRESNFAIIYRLLSMDQKSQCRLYMDVGRERVKDLFGRNNE
jgi:hypothetical protein